MTVWASEWFLSVKLIWFDKSQALVLAMEVWQICTKLLILYVLLFFSKLGFLCFGVVYPVREQAAQKVNKGIGLIDTVGFGSADY